jgi:zinc transporter ZupT
MNFVVHSLLLGSHHTGFDQNDHDTREEASLEESPLTPVCCSADPGANIDKLQRMGEEIEAREHNFEHDHELEEVGERERSQSHGHHEHSVAVGHLPSSSIPRTSQDEDDSDDLDDMGNDIDERSCSGEENRKLSKEEQRRLTQMSLNTAIAIALHNFPEGLATFISALADPRVGGILAIAIAIHNIPEGKTLEYCLFVGGYKYGLTKDFSACHCARPLC